MLYANDLQNNPFGIRIFLNYIMLMIKTLYFTFLTRLLPSLKFIFCSEFCSSYFLLLLLLLLQISLQSEKFLSSQKPSSVERIVRADISAFKCYHLSRPQLLYKQENPARGIKLHSLVYVCIAYYT